MGILKAGLVQAHVTFFNVCRFFMFPGSEFLKSNIFFKWYTSSAPSERQSASRPQRGEDRLGSL